MQAGSPRGTRDRQRPGRTTRSRERLGRRGGERTCGVPVGGSRERRIEGLRTLADVVGGMTDSEGAADGERGDDAAEDVFTDRAKLGIAIAAAGIVTAGLLDNLLTQQGAPVAGAVAWGLGFATTVVMLWYLLLRPIDIGGA